MSTPNYQPSTLNFADARALVAAMVAQGLARYPAPAAPWARFDAKAWPAARAARFVAAGLRTDGKPHVPRRHPELAGLTGAAYRRAWNALRRARRQEVEP